MCQKEKTYSLEIEHEIEYFYKNILKKRYNVYTYICIYIK